MRRSKVDLPQPDGPTKTTNSPLLDREIGIGNDDDVAEALPHILENDRAHYFTAPNVRPRTSCFCANQPSTRMGAMAMVEAAESLAQNKPSGLE